MVWVYIIPFHPFSIFKQQLFDAINPDKDTVTSRKVPKREMKDSEFWLLQKLAALMERANFYKLSESVVNKALDEHEAGEGVMVIN